MRTKNVILKVSVIFLLTLLLILAAFPLFRDRAGAFAFCIGAVGLTLAGVVIFEASDVPALKLSLTAAMTALSVAGRVVFAAVPFFKPVSAAVILCGMFLGALPGAVCGVVSALVSGLFFGLGLWTPFQALAWGAIGLLSGVFSKVLIRSRLARAVAGILAGISFSLVMDVFTVLGFGFGFGSSGAPSAYLAAVVSALPVTLTYSVSNVVFLFILTPPLKRAFARVLR